MHCFLHFKWRINKNYITHGIKKILIVSFLSFIVDVTLQTQQRAYLTHIARCLPGTSAHNCSEFAWSWSRSRWKRDFEFTWRNTFPMQSRYDQAQSRFALHANPVNFPLESLLNTILSRKCSIGIPDPGCQLTYGLYCTCQKGENAGKSQRVIFQKSQTARPLGSGYTADKSQ